MNYKGINKQVGNLDLYLLDQILKGNFDDRNCILDAGCGEGRNLPYFINNSYQVFGMDLNPQALLMAMMSYKSVPKEHWAAGDLEEIPHPDDHFDGIICSAVLHFARDYQHFDAIMTELVRVLKVGGILFIRTATEIGLAENEKNSEFTYLLQAEQLYNFNQLYSLDFLELPKSVVVNGQRSMGVLVMQKN
ncbi:MAG: class I SAM-dependent methyltransferase [Bacteroidota bacterium]